MQCACDNIAKDIYSDKIKRKKYFLVENIYSSGFFFFWLNIYCDIVWPRKKRTPFLFYLFLFFFLPLLLYFASEDKNSIFIYSWIKSFSLFFPCKHSHQVLSIVRQSKDQINSLINLVSDIKTIKIKSPLNLLSTSAFFVFFWGRKYKRRGILFPKHVLQC